MRNPYGLSDKASVREFAAAVNCCMENTALTDEDGAPFGLERGFQQLRSVLQSIRDSAHRVFLFGNGGSASIAEHISSDLNNIAKTRSYPLLSTPQVTAIANDVNYDAVFSSQVVQHSEEGDLVIAISSSGASTNVLTGVAAARRQGCRVLTLSGFAPDNPLRISGNFNLYVPSGSYAVVEVVHFGFLHALATGFSI